jgi:hypothetical protein
MRKATGCKLKYYIMRWYAASKYVKELLGYENENLITHGKEIILVQYLIDNFYDKSFEPIVFKTPANIVIFGQNRKLQIIQQAYHEQIQCKINQSNL